MPTPSNIAVLILAAGRSSRMETPKQLLPWRKTTLLGHAIETTLELDIDQVFVVLGANSELIIPKIESYSIQMIKNTNWQNGLGTSIACGIKYIQKLKYVNGVLIVLADQPLIDDEHLKELINAFKSGNSIVTTSYRSNKEGVPAIFDRSYFNDLTKLTNDFGAKTVIKNNTTFSVDGSNKIVDLDTKEEYKNLVKRNDI